MVLIPVDFFLHRDIVIPRYSPRFDWYFKKYIPEISNFTLKCMVRSESFETITVTAMIRSTKSVHVWSNTLLDGMRECCQNGDVVGCKF